MKRAVFLDKDGTIVRNVPYNVDAARIELAPGAVQGLRLIQEMGYALFVVSNQPGLELGKFTQAQLDAAQRHVASLLRRSGVEIDGCYYCPHAPETGCACRKPQSGLLERAAREHGIELTASWMIGDILHDVEAGRRAGCRSILIDNGNETEWIVDSVYREPDAIVDNLAEAALLVAGIGCQRCGGVVVFHYQNEPGNRTLFE